MTDAASALRHVPVHGDDGTELSSDATILPNGLLTTTQIPSRPDGSIDLGDIESQSRQTLDNLRTVLEANGSGMNDVAHLTIYLTDIATDRSGFNVVYQETFGHPLPVRCAVGVAALAVEGMRVEVTALAYAKSPARRA